MLTVTDIKYIRQEVNLKGRSYAEVARQMGHDVRTVKKYADQENWSEPKPKQQRRARVMGSVQPILDQWIMDDSKKKKKFQRTAKRMFDQLQSDYHFQGSYRTVREYVSRRKKERGQANEATLPLASRPGTAQVDFGEAPFLYRSESVTLSYLVLSFPYSNTFYFQVFPSQNRESFLEGLKRMFHYIGGVPKAIRFDNLSAAVKKVLPHGERQMTDEFQNFVFHYGFDVEFCNPAKGNEKGHVEAMVKYIRNNFLLPEVSFGDIDQLNRTLWLLAEEDRHRLHYQKEELLSALYQEEQNAWLQLPEKPFECVRYVEAKTDKYGYMKLDTRRYSTSPRFAKSSVLAKLSYNRVDIMTSGHDVIASHPRLYGAVMTSVKWQPYLDLMAKRPMALKYTSFYEQLPLNWQQYLEACTVPEKQQALRLLSVLLKEHDFSLAQEALSIASGYGHPETEAIKQVFYQLVHGKGIRQEIQVHRPVIPLMPPATRGTSHYDQLFDQEGVT